MLCTAKPYVPRSVRETSPEDRLIERESAELFTVSILKLKPFNDWILSPSFHFYAFSLCHICGCSSSTAFAPQGPDWWGKRLAWFSCENSLSLDHIWVVAHHIPSICMFRARVPNACLGVYESHEIQWLGSGVPFNSLCKGNPPLQIYQVLCFSGECVSKIDQILEFLPKSCLKPSKAWLDTFHSDVKLYKCLGLTDV